jgi:lipopolysaccharide biosynthesis regulator YciM
MARTFDELIELAMKADNDRRPITVIEALKAASALGEGLSSRYELMLADNLRAVGRIAEARRVMREIKEFPENKASIVNIQRGKIEEDSGNLQAAVHRYETAVEQNPGSTVPYVYLACAYSAVQQYEKANEVLKAGSRRKEIGTRCFSILGISTERLAVIRKRKRRFRTR